MYLNDSIYHVLNFSDFDHTSCEKHGVPWYGVEEDDSIDVHEVTAKCDLLILIKDSFRNTFYLIRIHVGSCAALFFLLGVVCWSHRYTQPFWHPLSGLEGSSGCYYWLHEEFTLSSDQWCDGISLHNQPILYRGRCIISFCPELVVLVHVICSPWCACPCSLGGASYHVKTGQPCSS